MIQGMLKNRRRDIYLLFNLKPINTGRKLTEDLVGLLVVLKLSRYEISQISQGLGVIQDLLRLLDGVE